MNTVARSAFALAVYVAFVACSGSESTSTTSPADASAGGDAAADASDGAAADAGGGDLAACKAAGGVACYAACAGSFSVKSSTACGGGLFCCVDETAPADGGSCDGGAPLCFGANTSHCCGNDPAGQAECVDGEWRCGGALAPGCNGTLCTAQDGG